MSNAAVPARRKVVAAKARRELLPGQSPELLQALHVMTREGHLNADGLRKLKQVNHLVGLVAPALAGEGPLNILEAGSGNAYFAFVLYELYLKKAEAGVVWCLEKSAALSERAQRRANELHFERMKFVTGPIAEFQFPSPTNLVVALHACDTSTDDALVAAVRAQARAVALVPCCQAEVANQLKEARSHVSAAFQALFSHPLHRREFGSHLTNVVRALVLEACGYQVTVTELFGWEHSLKNELIFARWVGHPNAIAAARLRELLAVTGVAPAALKALENPRAV